MPRRVSRRNDYPALNTACKKCTKARRTRRVIGLPDEQARAPNSPSRKFGLPRNADGILNDHLFRLHPRQPRPVMYRSHSVSKKPSISGVSLFIFALSLQQVPTENLIRGHRRIGGIAIITVFKNILGSSTLASGCDSKFSEL